MDPVSKAFDSLQAFRMLEDRWTSTISMSWIYDAVDVGLPARLTTPFNELRTGSVTWDEIQ